MFQKCTQSTITGEPLWWSLYRRLSIWRRRWLLQFLKLKSPRHPKRNNHRTPYVVYKLCNRPTTENATKKKQKKMRKTKSHSPWEVGSLPPAKNLYRKTLLKNASLFDRNSMETEMPAIHLHTDDANEIGSDSEVSPTHANLGPPIAIKTENEAHKLSSFQRQTTKSSSPKTSNPPDLRILTATIQLSRRDIMLYIILQFNQWEKQAVLDTLAILSGMSETELHRILVANPTVFIEDIPYSFHERTAWTELQVP